MTMTTATIFFDSLIGDPDTSGIKNALKALEQIRMREDWKTDMKVHYSAFSSVLKIVLSLISLSLLQLH